ncbi:MAG: hypothetical protein ACR2J8_06565 [Thermomicrobiales bacterium]
MNIARLAVVSATALALVAGSDGFASANEKPAEGPAVVITGGTISNTTDINVSASAGTGIADASGGSNNIGTSAGGGGIGAITASVGNGGSADASANGGAVSLGNVSSGSNSGNSIIVGNTNADGGKDGGWDGGKDGGMDGGHAEGAAGGGGGEMMGGVVALPSTGVGGFDAGMLSMIAAAGTAVAAGLGLRRR